MAIVEEIEHCLNHKALTNVSTQPGMFEMDSCHPMGSAARETPVAYGEPFDIPGTYGDLVPSH